MTEHLNDGSPFLFTCAYSPFPLIGDLSISTGGLAHLHLMFANEVMFLAFAALGFGRVHRHLDSSDMLAQLVYFFRR